MVAIVNLSQLHQAFSFGFGFRRNAVLIAFSISFSLSFQSKFQMKILRKFLLFLNSFDKSCQKQRVKTNESNATLL